MSLAHADPWVGYTKVLNLYPTSTTYIFIVDAKHPELSSCDLGRRFSIALDNPNYDALVSTLLLAYASGKEVYINVNGADYNGAVCSPTINRLMVK
jgi:hypothetical protein